MILDTNAISDLFREPPPDRLIQVLESADVHHLPVIVLGEFRYGLLSSNTGKLLEFRLNRLIETNIVLHLDEVTSQVYADVRHALKKRGSPIPENDIWIAALGIQYNLPIVTQDCHFQNVKELVVKNW